MAGALGGGPGGLIRGCWRGVGPPGSRPNPASVPASGIGVQEGGLAGVGPPLRRVRPWTPLGCERQNRARDPTTLLDPPGAGPGRGAAGAGGGLCQGAEPLITSLPKSITAPPGAGEMEKLRQEKGGGGGGGIKSIKTEPFRERGSGGGLTLP